MCFSYRLAYAIEWGIKIVYPLMFAIFNCCYWGFYLRKYCKLLFMPFLTFIALPIN